MAMPGYGFDGDAPVQEAPLSMVVGMLDRVGELHGLACKEASEAEFRYQQAVRRREELQEIGAALNGLRNRLDRVNESVTTLAEPQARGW